MLPKTKMLWETYRHQTNGEEKKNMHRGKTWDFCWSFEYLDKDKEYYIVPIQVTNLITPRMWPCRLNFAPPV